MADDPLKSFTIGERQRPVVRPSKAAPPTAEPAPSPSAGFPGIEARLEARTLEEVADELRPAYAALEAMTSGTDPRTKAAGRRAMVAYERAADLFEYLYETKEAMAQPGPEDSE